MHRMPYASSLSYSSPVKQHSTLQDLEAAPPLKSPLHPLPTVTHLPLSCAPSTSSAHPTTAQTVLRGIFLFSRYLPDLGREPWWARTVSYPSR